MTFLADDIKTVLTESPAIGVDGAMSPSGTWPIFIATLPASPENAIQVTETGGTPPHPSLLLDYLTAQIMVLAAENAYQAGRQKAQDIKDRLLGIFSRAVGTNWWVSVIMVGDIVYLGKDETNHHLFSNNFRFIVEPGASALTHRTAL